MSRSTRLIHLFWLNRWFTDTQILHGEAVSWCMQFNITISCSTFLFHSEVWLRWYNKTGVDFTSMEKVVPSVIVSTKHSLPCLAITVKGGATASWYFFFFFSLLACFWHILHKTGKYCTKLNAPWSAAFMQNARANVLLAGAVTYTWPSYSCNSLYTKQVQDLCSGSIALDPKYVMAQMLRAIRAIP